MKQGGNFDDSKFKKVFYKNQNLEFLRESTSLTNFFSK